MPWSVIEPVKSARIYEEIVRQIKALIIENKIKIGERLPAERELAEKFRVSRTSVREALKTLESLNMVEIKQGGGTYVKEVSIENLIEPLVNFILTRREAVAELFEARRVIEPGIAYLAAQRATEPEIEGMSKILEKQAMEIKSGRTGVQMDNDFHDAIAAASHNKAIVRIVHLLMDLLTQSREEALQIKGRPRFSYKAHLAILKWIREKNPEKAKEAMERHIREIEELVMKDDVITLRS